MKTQLTLLILMLLGMGSVMNAQDDYAFTSQRNATNSTQSNKGFYVGVRGVPQLTWMLNADDVDNSAYENRTKFRGAFGIGAGYNFTENIGLTMDVLYSLQGKQYEVMGMEYTQKLDYIKIPLMFSYTTRPATVMFVGKIGPQLNILTNADIDPVILNGITSSDNKDMFMNIVFGGAINAGARYAITEDFWLDAGLRFDCTFTNVEDEDYVYYPADRARTYNMTAGVEVGLNYRIK